MNMQLLVTQPEIFQLATQRAAAFAEANYPNCDVEFVDLLPKLNALPGVATLWCCASHVETNEDDSQFYLTLAVTVEGIEHAVRIYTELCKIAQPKLDDETGCSLRLEYGCLHGSLFNMPNVRYNVTSIHCIVSNAENKRVLLDSLAEALTNQSDLIE